MSSGRGMCDLSKQKKKPHPRLPLLGEELRGSPISCPSLDKGRLGGVSSTAQEASHD